jgi:hypothetical protein
MRKTFNRRKRPYERFPLEWDFGPELAQIFGDSIATFAVTVTDEAGADSSAAMLDTTALFGTVVQAWIKDGGASIDYFVNYKVVTAAGAKWEHDILVPVSSEA